jgi:hypothetical protein
MAQRYPNSPHAFDRVTLHRSTISILLLRRACRRTCGCSGAGAPEYPLHYNRVREGNFDRNGLVGFNMARKAVGVDGTGKIGTALARIVKGYS